MCRLTALFAAVLLSLAAIPTAPAAGAPQTSPPPAIALRAGEPLDGGLGMPAPCAERRPLGWGADPALPLRIVVLIYTRTDVVCTGPDGVAHRYVGQMTNVQTRAAAHRATIFVTEDIPALASHMVTPTLSIVYPEHPLRSLTPHLGGFWPAPGDTAADRDLSYDSAIIIWQPSVVDRATGEQAWIASAAGLAFATPEQLYTTLIIEAAAEYPHRNVYRHEWGHSILSYFEHIGAAPLPSVDSHAPERYVNCRTGEPYAQPPEGYEPAPPGAIYNNYSGFTHDYYSGETALASDPTRCLGIGRAAWAAGGPASRALCFHSSRPLAVDARPGAP